MSVEFKRVLVIDDEEPILMMMENLLEIMGYEMVGFTMAKEGLEQLKKENFYFIVCDLSLPDLDGREFFKRAIQIKPGIRRNFIFSSGYLNDGDILEFCQSNDIKFLGKPFKIEDIQKLINDLK